MGINPPDSQESLSADDRCGRASIVMSERAANIGVIFAGYVGFLNQEAFCAVNRDAIFAIC